MRITRLIVPLLACVLSLPAVPEDAAEQAQEALQAGQWRYSSPRTPIGAGTDHIVRLSQDDGRWQIVLITENYPSFNNPERKPTITKDGPYPVTAEDGVIAWEADGKLIAMTYEFKAGSLTMPAIIEREPGRWYFFHKRRGIDPEEGVPELEPFITLEHSHRKRAAGTASFPGLSGGEGWYIYREPPVDPDRPDRIPNATLYLLGLDEREGMKQQSRLVFYNRGTPFEQVYFVNQAKVDRGYRTTVYQRDEEDKAGEVGF